MTQELKSGHKSDPKSDIETLAEAGINIDQLVSATAHYVRNQTLFRFRHFHQGLNRDEQEFLYRAGVPNTDDSQLTNKIATKLAESASEYGALIAQSLPQKSVADRLGVSPSRIRQRIDQGTLYAVPTAQGRVCPVWQFEGNETLPGLDIVLKAMHPKAHPIAIQRFFTSPQPDLEIELEGRLVELSPVEWLKSGYPPEEVALLIQDI